MPDRPHTANDSRGVFNYLHAAATPSLYRNGKVLTRRDPDGNDAGFVGVVPEAHDKHVFNARRFASDDRCTLARTGFELVDRSLDDAGLSFFDHEQVVRAYYPQCEDVVRRTTGVRAFAFDHNVRSATRKHAGERIAGGQHVQEPLRFVHGDYTLTSAPQRLRDLAAPPSGNDALRSVLGAGESLVSKEAAGRALDDGRFAIINVWRNIASEPVARLPLALCDAQTVHPEDLVVFEIHYQDRVGENYFSTHEERHRWCYFPGMTRNEALLIKQWDSAGPMASSEGRQGDATDPERPCTFSFHSAFDDPATPPDALDRQSIEVRCIVIYD